ncbi:hypothetical protein Bbelb_274000 [Branchiostoma belcheri]|nr:hypothetical protein Bbelb_274000 [Branchiostoma belcheri]
MARDARSRASLFTPSSSGATRGAFSRTRFLPRRNRWRPAEARDGVRCGLPERQVPRLTYDRGGAEKHVRHRAATVRVRHRSNCHSAHGHPQTDSGDSLWKESIAANLRGIINTGWRFPRGHLRRPPPGQKNKARETEALPWISEVSEISTYSHSSVSRIEVRQDNNSAGTVSLVSFSKWRR